MELLCGTSHLGMVALEVSCMTGASLWELLVFFLLPFLRFLSLSVTAVMI